MKKYLLLLMIFICSFLFSAEPVDFKAKLVKGEVFPEFVLEKLSGTKELSTEVFDKNKKTLIVLAAEWCPACQWEMGQLAKFYESNKTKYNIAVIFIRENSSEAKVKEYVGYNNYTFPVYFDYSGKILQGTGVESIPTNIVLDKNRKISAVKSGIWEEGDFINNLK